MTFINIVELSSLNAINDETFGETRKRIQRVCEKTCETDDYESTIYNAIIMETFVPDSPCIALAMPFAPTIS